MSSSLVKRLLRASADLTEESSSTVEQRPTKRRRRQTNVDETTPANKEEIVASRVRQMLALDRYGTKNKDVSQNYAKELDQKREEKKSTQQAVRRAIVTNSRSAALQATQQHERTFDKKAYRRAKEKQKLQEIARKLKAFTKRKKM